jgi:hypothetical protein
VVQLPVTSYAALKAEFQPSLSPDMLSKQAWLDHPKVHD